MEFKDKYAPDSASTEEKKNKKVISDDFYAIGEMLQELYYKLEQLRQKLVGLYQHQVQQLLKRDYTLILR